MNDVLGCTPPVLDAIRDAPMLVRAERERRRPVLGRPHRGVSGQLPGGRIEVVRGALADSAEPRWWSEAHLGTG